MNHAVRKDKFRVRRTALIAALAFALVGASRARAQQGNELGLQISANAWGTVVAPVFGSSESGPYAGAELFAGPNKFGSYFKGVLPNGRIAKPVGVSVQVGM